MRLFVLRLPQKRNLTRRASLWGLLLLTSSLFLLLGESFPIRASQAPWGISPEPALAQEAYPPPSEPIYNPYPGPTDTSTPAAPGSSPTAEGTLAPRPTFTVVPSPTLLAQPSPGTLTLSPTVPLAQTASPSPAAETPSASPMPITPTAVLPGTPFPAQRTVSSPTPDRAAILIATAVAIEKQTPTVEAPTQPQPVRQYGGFIALALFLLLGGGYIGLLMRQRQGGSGPPGKPSL